MSGRGGEGVRVESARGSLRTGRGRRPRAPPPLTRKVEPGRAGVGAGGRAVGVLSNFARVLRAKLLPPRGGTEGAGVLLATRPAWGCLCSGCWLAVPKS